MDARRAKIVDNQRVNMDVDRSLWRRTKAEAARQGKTLRRFVSELLDKSVPSFGVRHDH